MLNIYNITVTVTTFFLLTRHWLQSSCECECNFQPPQLFLDNSNPEFSDIVHHRLLCLEFHHNKIISFVDNFREYSTVVVAVA